MPFIFYKMSFEILDIELNFLNFERNGFKSVKSELYVPQDSSVYQTHSI